MKKIMHICLDAPYFGGMGYQENILPRVHRKMGFDVSIVTFNSSRLFKTRDGVAIFDWSPDKLTQETSFVNEDGIRVIALKGKRLKLLRMSFYLNLSFYLRQINPDIIFVHGPNFTNLYEVVRYVRCRRRLRSDVDLYIDCHSDYYNLPVGWRPLKTLFRTCKLCLFYGHFIRRAARYVKKYWGVTPWRCQYLHEIYRAPKEKIDLLVMGGEDDKIRFEQKDKIREEIRKKYNIKNDDKVVITGGRVGRAKNFQLLFAALDKMNDSAKIKLLVFGSPDAEMKPIFDRYADDPRVRLIGWLGGSDVYDYFLAADLAVFPGTHSVLWEQACACGLPCLFKEWPGMKHVDVGGNCLFLTRDSSDEIAETINRVLANDGELLAKMRRVAMEKATKVFSYNEIAKRAIGL